MVYRHQTQNILPCGKLAAQNIWAMEIPQNTVVPSIISIKCNSISAHHLISWLPSDKQKHFPKCCSDISNLLFLQLLSVMLGWLQRWAWTKKRSEGCHIFGTHKPESKLERLRQNALHDVFQIQITNCQTKWYRLKNKWLGNRNKE